MYEYLASYRMGPFYCLFWDAVGIAVICGVCSVDYCHRVFCIATANKEVELVLEVQMY